MVFDEVEQFTKEFRRLKKKYPSLDSDFENIKGVIAHFPKGRGEKHWNMLKEKGCRYVFKTRMMCRSVRGSSFRLIYFFDEEVGAITFIEMYYKGEKGNEDEGRIAEVFKRLN